MKKKRVRQFSEVLAFLTMAALFLVSCGPSATTQPTSALATGESAGAEASGEVNILYIDNPTWWSEQAARFSESSGIKVNWEGVPFDKLHDKMFTAFAAGSAPWDTIHVRDDWLAEFASRGFLMPLDDRITPEMKAQFPELAWENLSFNGHIYGVPRYFWLYQFYYNKDLLSAAGLTAPATWDEVTQAAAKLTADTNGDGKVDRWGYCEPWGENFASYPFIFHLRAAGGELFDAGGKPIFNSEAGVKALSWMVDMAKSGNVCPSAFELMTTGALTELFLQGSVAMMPCTPQVYGMAADPTKSKLTVGQIGTNLMPGDAVKSGTFAETGGLAIPAKAANPDAAWKYIEFVTSKEEETRMAVEPGNVPANLEALADPSVLNKQPNYQFVAEQMKYPFGAIKDPRAQEINGAIARNVIRALHGEVSPKDALDQAYEEVVSIMNQ